jgi:diketogulonate reductase-like aldo/keto reductase
MWSIAEGFTLANGVRVPKIGFGTWQIPDGDPAYDATLAALQLGYRHIDTARAYRNEASIARAVADSGVARGELFLTTKLPAALKTYDEAKASFADSAAALGTDYVDLYLIHFPAPLQDPHGDYRAGNAEVWRAIEELYAAGRVQAIGVSNFSVEDIEALLKTAKVAPHVNQIKFHIGNTEAEITAFCQDSAILVEGYSPLATGALLDNVQLAHLAARYGKSVAQLSIRYLLQRDVLPLPKSTTPSRMAANIDVDFQIGDEDMAFLDSLHATT